ncbi:zinc-binding dehydrogenase [Streptomyces sp. NPDC087300]|uniref:zinc-binding dehydrogenase n=1 Tax=Streptomyces sp. NPDC087300 TaxID=3365780 RepID=UPI0038141E63
MRAVVLHEFGPAENLRYETLPDPVAGVGQVRIAVRAAGTHFVETVLRRGDASDMAPPLPELPAVFGGEAAGTVDAVGPGVDPGWIGRSVVAARTSPGGYAELSVADVERLHVLPDGLGPEGAVTMVGTGATTMGLLASAQLTSDDVVLVTSAAGGVGRLVVQYAHALGATVVGAAGGDAKTAAVRALGADVVVDYNEDGWADTLREGLGADRPVTVVIDGVGGQKAARAYELLGAGGRFVAIGWSSQEPFEPTPEELAERGTSYVNALLELLGHPERAPEHERAALEAAAKGELVPSWEAFPLARAADAHAAMERRETTGKVLLVP